MADGYVKPARNPSSAIARANAVEDSTKGHQAYNSLPPLDRRGSSVCPGQLRAHSQINHSRFRRIHNQRFVIRVARQAGKLCPLVLGASYSEGQCPSVFIVNCRTRPILMSTRFNKPCFPSLAIPRAQHIIRKPYDRGMVSKYV